MTAEGAGKTLLGSANYPRTCSAELSAPSVTLRPCPRSVSSKSGLTNLRNISQVSVLISRPKCWLRLSGNLNNMAETAEIKFKLDDRELTVPPGTLVIEAARQQGIEVPSFCYYAGLALQAACRMCLVEVEKADRKSTRLNSSHT